MGSTAAVRKRIAVAATVFCSIFKNGHAVERDVTPYPNGVETFSVGIMPAPGTYYYNSTQFYTATRLNNSQGVSSFSPFSTDVIANSFRFDEVWPVDVLGGNIGSRIIFPLVDIDTRMLNRQQSKTGLGNVTITPLVIGWHRENLHWLTGVDIDLPIGSWKATDLVNTFENYAQFEPHLDITYVVPKGPEVDVKFMYDFNTTNNVTDYHSGQTFHMDFASGWNFGALTAGLVGYFLTQTTDDTIGRVRVGPNGNRTRSLALGPGLRYVWRNIRVQANWKHDVIADNHTQGNSYWLRFVVPF
jgi:hypothetical protein